MTFKNIQAQHDLRQSKAYALFSVVGLLPHDKILVKLGLERADLRQIRAKYAFQWIAKSHQICANTVNYLRKHCKFTVKMLLQHINKIPQKG